MPETSNKQLILWLKSDFDKFKEKRDRDLKSINNKLDSLIKTKYTILGWASGAGFISGVVGAILLIILRKVI